MRWIIAIPREIFGLFVDDGRFALSILVWLAAVAWLQPILPVPSQWRGAMLFAGLALALVWSCLHQVARHASRPN
jgi:hypothetical protein